MPILGLAYLLYTKVLTHTTLVHMYSLVSWFRSCPTLEETDWVVLSLPLDKPPKTTNLTANDLIEPPKTTNDID